jgi:hypothetical protein
MGEQLTVPAVGASLVKPRRNRKGEASNKPEVLEPRRQGEGVGTRLDGMLAPCGAVELWPLGCSHPNIP